jgi:hypothetical protein
MAKTSPRDAAQGFASHLNTVLNATVTDARITTSATANDRRFSLAHVSPDGLPTAFALAGTDLSLLFHQVVEVQDDGHCRTISYNYRLASGPAKSDWILRWEYNRKPPAPDYRYVRGHLHVNARLTDEQVEQKTAKGAAHLHLATGRVPFELVVWHLIAEWGVDSRTSAWQDVLGESLDGFEERQNAI